MRVGLESLQDRRWYKNLCVFFYEIFNSISPKYLSDIVSNSTRSYAPRNMTNIPIVRVNNNYIMNSFFLCTTRVSGT